MNKKFVLGGMIFLLLCLYGCSGKNQAAAGLVNTKAEESAKVDVDLTQLSSIMVYSEVYNIMANPDEYLGKTIKMEGPYYSYYWDSTDKYYHYIVVEDAAACCNQGIEFIWDDNRHQYPSEYPADNTPVEIVGIFGAYEEEGEVYYYLAANELTVSQISQ